MEKTREFNRKRYSFREKGKKQKKKSMSNNNGGSDGMVKIGEDFKGETCNETIVCLGTYLPTTVATHILEKDPTHMTI